MKSRFGIFVIVLLVLTLLPVSVFAAEPAELDLRVYNRTEGPVSVRLTAADGTLQYLELPVGVSELTLTEGIYEYYVVTSCGTQVGQWNVNVVKELLIKCSEDVLELSLQRACPDNKWGHYYYLPEYDTHWYMWFDNINGPDLLEVWYGDPDLLVLDQGIGCWDGYGNWNGY